MTDLGEWVDAAYQEAQSWGTEYPRIVLTTQRTYLAFRFCMGHKLPRKLKKWAVGTRGSRRRKQIHWIECLKERAIEERKNR